MYNFIHNFFKNLQILYLKNKSLSAIVRKDNRKQCFKKRKKWNFAKKITYTVRKISCGSDDGV